MQLVTESLISTMLMLGWIMILSAVCWLGFDAWNRARRIPRAVRRVVTRARNREVWTRTRP